MSRGIAATGTTCTSVTGSGNTIIEAGNWVDWITHPVAHDFTLSGDMSFNLWGIESSMNANAWLTAHVEKVDGATGDFSPVYTQLGTFGAELGTSAAVRTSTVSPDSSVNFKKGDRIRVRVGFRDIVGTTMGNGFTLTFRQDGPTAGADGDSYVDFTEDLSFMLETNITDDPKYQTTVGSNEFIGDLSNDTRQAIRFHSYGGLMQSIDIKVKKFGSPADNLEMAVQADSSGTPSGTDIVSTSISGASLTTSFQILNQDFTDTQISPGVYWIVLRRSGSLDLSNYYVSECDTNTTVAGTWTSTYNGSSWSATRTGGHVNYFRVYMAAQGSTIYPTDTNTTIDAGVGTHEKEAWTSRGGSSVGRNAHLTHSDFELIQVKDSPSSTPLITQLTSATNVSLKGTGFSFEAVAQSITPAADDEMSSASFYFTSTGSPVDNVKCALQADSSGSPSGTDLVSETISSTDIWASGRMYEFKLGYNLVGGTKYWLVLTRTGASNTNYYGVWNATTNAYASGDRATKTSGVWSVNTSEDMSFTVDQSFLEWYSRPLQAMTLSGRVECQFSALETNTNANMGIAGQLAITDTWGGNAVNWGYGAITTELSTSSARYTIYLAGPDTAIASGSRLRFRAYATWPPIGPASTLTSESVTLEYNGATPSAAGDTKLSTIQTLDEFVILPHISMARSMQA